MTVARTNGVFPGGGSVVLPGRALRKSFWAQNQSIVQTMDIAFSSGFTLKALGPGTPVTRTIAGGGDVEGLQGSITLSGTPGEPYDVEESYS